MISQYIMISQYNEIDIYFMPLFILIIKQIYFSKEQFIARLYISSVQKVKRLTNIGIAIV